MTREFFLKESMIMLSVVIPTFNESKNIRNLVAQIDVALRVLIMRLFLLMTVRTIHQM